MKSSAILTSLAKGKQHRGKVGKILTIKPAMAGSKYCTEIPLHKRKLGRSQTSGKDSGGVGK